MQQPFHLFLLLCIIIIYSLFPTSGAQLLPFEPSGPSANVSTKWINNGYSLQSFRDETGQIIIRNILERTTSDSISGPGFGCGFICPSDKSPGSCKSFLFSIILGSTHDPQIVWSANRDRPVRENATLEFSQNGDLVLRDFDGTTVWSTNTSGMSVVRMELNQVASLVLFDNNNNTVWSSMDYPTDSLVLGQTLREGQRLTANVSPTNSSQGPLYLSVVNGGFQAFAGSQMYYNTTYYTEQAKIPSYVLFNNHSLDILVGSESWNTILLSPANSFQYMRLDYAGHLRLYEWSSYKPSLLTDVIKGVNDDECAFPTVCGEYGICSHNGQCSCPTSDNDGMNYFRLVDPMNPILGCLPLNALSCNNSAKTHQLLSFINVDYFYTVYSAVYMKNTNAEACKQACLANCSCKAAIFQYYGNNAFSGNCYLPSELYSLTYNKQRESYNSTAFIKVQSFPVTNLSSGTNSNKFVKSKKGSVGAIVGATVASLLAFILIIACVIALLRMRYSYREVEDADEFDMLPGLPVRFTFEDLRVATNDFLQKLGEGGFGSVFEGTLIDGTKIAVKRLDGVGQGKKEFLAEVETIGSIHHLHLVRLVGFCAEKAYRLLVYEYMINGSLDKWIFYKNHDAVLDWQTRRKIIVDIAKGLTYLHEDCRQKIVHMDIKPQNILLDENFNAKVSDFGLAKLIDRGQIEVMTRMRGTPRYLAPEWLTSVITEKVDVFSYGVVVLEVVCGRRNLDHSKDEEDFHLISLLQRKIAENRLVDLVDYRCTDMQIHIEDVLMIMHLAMWCLQSDINKRPSMSVVLNVLKGSMDVETSLDYNFTNPTSYVSRNANIVESVQLIPSMLSGPR